MFVGSSYKDRYVHYQDVESPLKFFVQAGRLAVNDFKKREKDGYVHPDGQYGRKLYKGYKEEHKHGLLVNRKEKSDVPIITATAIENFNPTTDSPIRRAELNKRHPKRNFIEIDWDIDDEVKLKEMKEQLKEFASKHKTVVFYYPSASFPKKQRGRSILFIDGLVGEHEYRKAVKWALGEIGVDNKDGNSFDLKHNFNLPCFNHKAQLDELTLIQPKEVASANISPLSPTLWKDTKVKKKRSSNNGELNEYSVTSGERQKRSARHVANMIPILIQRFNRYDNRTFDLDEYNQFFQFLHSVARTEVLGAIDRDGAEAILRGIAQGNRYYERQNIKDYQAEFSRVSADVNKLLKARPMSFYAGQQW